MGVVDGSGRKEAGDIILACANIINRFAIQFEYSWQSACGAGSVGKGRSSGKYASPKDENFLLNFF